ncbi:MAG: FAD:protein FMN transferase [Myxococcales bacterium]|nr:FAD:protein FMN transferase [Myxococcales bacterium]
MARPVVDGPSTLRRFVLPGLFVAALFVVLWVRRPETAGGERVVRLEGPTMGTRYHVTVVVPADGPDEAALKAAVDGALAEVNGAMSTYLPDSALSRFNRYTGEGPFDAPAGLIAVAAKAQTISEATGGAFDVTVGPLVRAWGFGPDKPGEAPDAAALVALRQRVGWRLLSIDEGAGTLSKARPDLEIDLSAIAKGYGVDRAAAALADLGAERYLVEVGGEVVARGTNPDGQPWRLGIEKPALDGSGGVQEVVALSDRAMATSGDYRNFREVDGQRVSHTIDPRTARPITHGLASVSVVADDCTTADAWATALNVLGPEAGLAAATDRNLAALFIIRSPEGGGFTTHATPAFEALRAAPAQ